MNAVAVTVTVLLTLAGAAIVFSGTVRACNHWHAVRGIARLEAYINHPATHRSTP